MHPLLKKILDPPLRMSDPAGMNNLVPINSQKVSLDRHFLEAHLKLNGSTELEELHQICEDRGLICQDK